MLRQYLQRYGSDNRYWEQVLTTLLDNDSDMRVPPWLLGHFMVRCAQYFFFRLRADVLGEQSTNAAYLLRGYLNAGLLDEALAQAILLVQHVRHNFVNAPNAES